MADFKLAGPTRRTQRTRNTKTRKRAQTDVKQKEEQIDTNPEAKQEQDDFLDFLGIQQQPKKEEPQDQNGVFSAFDDDFGGFGSSDSAQTPPTKPVVSKDDHAVKSTKKRKKKMSQKPPLKKAKTVANTQSPSSHSSFEHKSNGSSPSSTESPNSPKQKSAVKMKKIDVLPLLHRGIRANKFKINGNKSKVRTFYLTSNNFYFCWEVVGQATDKKGGGGLFGGKNKGNNTRSKVDKERSIPIRSIRSLQKNPAYTMQSYNFIPAESKAYTLTILYSMHGQDKKLNFMAYEPFHHTLFHEGLQQLIAAARDPKRNLNEVFELYVDFPKEILPKHLRPQRFKWEPLQDNDYAAQGSDTENANSNMYFDASPDKFANMEVYDPTASGSFGRNRVKSF